MADHTLPAAERDARAHQLAADGASHRAIGRALGIHHTTVARILRTTPAPPTAPQDAPPPATSKNAPIPGAMFKLTPQLIRDLNVLANRWTGELPAPLVHAIHAEAEKQRAIWRDRLNQLAAGAKRG
ncbi:MULTISPECIES: hypothetical protein [unclassified Streptomyces]|uniref:hypothetical protein n=1 Tax=unclassified Streptomyces TaxID=2593676 RepID=UPI0035D7FFE0